MNVPLQRRLFCFAAALASWFLAGGLGFAADWPKVIRTLERAAATRTNKSKLAVAYNNYGIELSQKSKWEAAEASLQKAVKLSSDNKRFRLNLAMTYLNHAFDLKNSTGRGNNRGTQHKAKTLAQAALRYDNSLAAAHVLIGDVEYDSQRLDRARKSWERARILNPGLPGLADRIDKLDREYDVERRFERAATAFFDVRYQGRMDRSSAIQLRDTLREARSKIGRDFGHWPSRKIVVLVYSPEQFSQVRSGPDWVGGLYDGKIRVPVAADPNAVQAIKPTLYHEFTHAIIHDITGNRCPVWLNEGLAEYQESRLRRNKLRTLKQAAASQNFIPMQNLDAAFQHRDGRVAGLAYEQSYSMVVYLEQQYGFFRLTRLLERIAKGEELEAALRQEFVLTTEQLEAKWRKWLPGYLRSI